MTRRGEESPVSGCDCSSPDGLPTACKGHPLPKSDSARVSGKSLAPGRPAWLWLDSSGHEVLTRHPHLKTPFFADGIASYPYTRAKVYPGQLTALFLATDSECEAYNRVFPRPDASEYLVNGSTLGDLDRVHDVVVEFMFRNMVPNLSLGVTSPDGRLVAALGYTNYRFYSQNQSATLLSTTPQSLFRIASISKPITAAAILKLAQDGTLTLVDKVMDWVDLSPPLGHTLDPRHEDITIIDLLTHRGGWDRTAGPNSDPFWNDAKIAQEFNTTLPVTQEQIIKYMGQEASTQTEKAEHVLVHDPGTTYAYSNYGYMLLGRVIEAATTASYESWVKQNVLKPMGIEETLLGHTLLEDRQLYEMHYFGRTIEDRSNEGVDHYTHKCPGCGQEPCKNSVMYSEVEQSVRTLDLGWHDYSFFGTINTTANRPCVPCPYGGFNLENRDSFGGWVSNILDLLRFALDLNGRGSHSQVLSPGIGWLMFQDPYWSWTDPNTYGLGWYLSSQGNAWHTGETCGNQGRLWLYRPDHGTLPNACFCYLFNTNLDESCERELRDEMWRVMQDISDWGTGDLYADFS